MTTTLHPLAMPLLDRLLHSDHWIMPRQFIGELASDPAAIRSAMESLRQAGCKLEDHPQLGVKLIEAGLGCWADYIEARRAAPNPGAPGVSGAPAAPGPRPLGWKLHVYRTTPSTQDVARGLASSSTGKAADGAGQVVVADYQQAGRGRLGRRWVAPPGATLLLTAIVDAAQVTDDRLMMASCVAVAKLAESLTGRAASIRWPNDVLCDGRKLSGILIERVGRLALVGIGLNAQMQPDQWPAELRGRAVSLAELEARIDRLLILDRLLESLEHACINATDDDLLAFWRDRSSLLQRRVMLDAAGRRVIGRVIDLDPRAGLLVAIEGGGVATIEASSASLLQVDAKPV